MCIYIYSLRRLVKKNVYIRYSIKLSRADVRSYHRESDKKSHKVLRFKRIVFYDLHALMAARVYALVCIYSRQQHL